MKIIVGKTAGFCYGVKRAVEGSIEQIENSKDENIYCLGELVHNKQVILKLKEEGMNFIENIEQIQGKNTKVIIRAHGITKQMYKFAQKNKINIKDYTCPNVLKIHKIAEEYSKKGYYIFLCGKKQHPENIGTISYCGKYFSVIEDEKEVNKALKEFSQTNKEKILIIAQTTYSVKKFSIIEELIKKKIKEDVEIIVNNTICKATEVRQKETQELSKKVDCMIIIGGKNSSNTNKLYEISKSNCSNTILIETEQEIKKEQIKQYNMIGIMAGASTPRETINNVVKQLEKQECMSIL